MTDERIHDARDAVPTGVKLTALDQAFRHRFPRLRVD